MASRLVLRLSVVSLLFMFVVWVLVTVKPAPPAVTHVPQPAKIAQPPLSSEEIPGSSRGISFAGLRIPVAGITADELRDSYDDPRSGGRRHEAIDIMAQRGAAVLAATPGTIIRRDRSASGGRSIYQYNSDSTLVYYYAHLWSYEPGVSRGVRVALGDTIGYVGDSGNAPEGVHHLHFAIWEEVEEGYFWDGETINPYPLLVESE